MDPEAPAGTVISALGIERDGFRGNWLAVNVSMLVPSAEVTAAAGGEESEEDTGWAGVYVARFLDDEPSRTERGRFLIAMRPAAAQAAAVVSERRNGLSVVLQVGGLS